MRQGVRGAVLLVGTALLVSAAPAHAAFPGQNGRIAFVNSGGIATMGADGSGVLAVTTGSDPMWSPDGDRIAFVRSGAGWFVNSDGSSPQQIPGVSSNFGPAWSPDGSTVAFSNNPGAALPHVFRVNLDGTGMQQLTGCDPDNPDYGAGRDPTWSPTGQRIAYQAVGIVIDDGDEHLGNWGPGTVLATGCGELGIGGTTWDAFDNTYLDWSPDGTKLAFSGPPSMFCPPGICYGSGPNEIWVVNADGSNPVNLTNSAAQDVQPAWSPDGTKIAFSSAPSGQDSEIYTMNADGTGVTQLTGNATPDSLPSWQPLPARYPRPKGATPVRVPLVPAHVQCTAPNRTHGPPLAFGSCNPPVPASSRLTIGVGDGSPAFARGSGFVRVSVLVGVPGPPEDSDVEIRFDLTNVMRASDLSEYTGELRAELTVRRTDREPNGVASTSSDFPFRFTVECAPTPGSSLDASTCSTFTSVNTLVPGAITDGRRAIWALDKVRAYDGGPDEDADTEGDNSLFMTQGLFVP